MFTNPAQPLEPIATFRWTCSGGGPARAWITATAVALGVFGDEADAAVVFYQLTGAVQQATYNPALVGMPMYLQWSVDSAAVVDGSSQKTVPIIDFRYGVAGTNEQWAGTGGVFYFNANHLGIGLSANQATYTQQGTFVTSEAYYSYRSLTGPMVTDWTAEGLPAGFTLAFIDPVTTTPFYVKNASMTSRIFMNETAGVTFAMVPEPTTAALLGLSGLAALRRRKRSHE